MVVLTSLLDGVKPLYITYVYASLKRLWLDPVIVWYVFKGLKRLWLDPFAFHYCLWPSVALI